DVRRRRSSAGSPAHVVDLAILGSGGSRMAELPDPYCDAVLVGSIPVATVYETDRVWAFHHPRPSFDPVHIVLIPKEHVDSLVTLRSRDVDLQLEVLHALSVLGEEVVRAHGECQMHVNLGHYL